MNAEPDAAHVRQYVLGMLDHDERDAIERAYFDRAEALDRLCAAEDDLIDDYLSGRLPAIERDPFERHYLATPVHRTRVQVARELRRASAAPSRGAPSWSAPIAAVQTWTRAGQAGLGAAAVILLAVGVWLFDPRSSPPVVTDTTASAPAATTSPPSAERRTPDRRDPDRAAEPPGTVPAPSPTPPVVVALSLSPIHVRGGDEPASLAIAPGTDVVALGLQGQPGDARLRRGRAIVRTVGGSEVWRGPAVDASGSQPPAYARVEIPATQLPPEDYIVELLESDASGTDVERYRYFFRVRRP